MPSISPALMNRTAVIARSQGEIREGGGRWRDRPPTIVGSKAVRISSSSAAETSYGGMMGALVTHAIYTLPGDPDVRRGDELEIDGKLYRVVDVQLPSEAIYVKMLATEVQRAHRPV